MRDERRSERRRGGRKMSGSVRDAISRLAFLRSCISLRETYFLPDIRFRNFALYLSANATHRVDATDFSVPLRRSEGGGNRARDKTCGGRINVRARGRVFDTATEIQSVSSLSRCRTCDALRLFMSIARNRTEPPVLQKSRSRILNSEHQISLDSQISST